MPLGHKKEPREWGRVEGGEEASGLMIIVMTAAHSIVTH